MVKARLSRFLIDRIHRDWVDGLFPQGWVEEEYPYPTGYDTTINSKGIKPSAHHFSES